MSFFHWEVEHPFAAEVTSNERLPAPAGTAIQLLLAYPESQESLIAARPDQPASEGLYDTVMSFRFV